MTGPCDAYTAATIGPLTNGTQVTTSSFEHQ
jgi:hypothetical protein